MNKIKKRNFDLAIILIWPIIAAILCLSFNVNPITSIALFLIAPSIYLGWRGKEYLKKVAIFSLLAAIPAIIIIDYIAHLTGAWLVITTIFPRLFSYIVIEVVIWAYFTVFFVVIFYEYFINKHKTKNYFPARMKYFFLIGAILLIIFFSFLFFFPAVLNIPYFYLWAGIILMVIPFLFQFLNYPKTTSKIFLAGAYFFYLHFIYEITALKLGLWDFPGPDFIGWIQILGVKFPIEELFFWFILLALTILAFYEYFDDDEK